MHRNRIQKCSKTRSVYMQPGSFTEITRDHPGNVAAQMYLGQTLFREEKFAATIVPYEKVRALEKSGAKLTLTQHRILGDQLARETGETGDGALILLISESKPSGSPPPFQWGESHV